MAGVTATRRRLHCYFPPRNTISKRVKEFQSTGSCLQAGPCLTSFLVKSRRPPFTLPGLHWCVVGCHCGGLSPKQSAARGNSLTVPGGNCWSSQPRSGGYLTGTAWQARSGAQVAGPRLTRAKVCCSPIYATRYLSKYSPPDEPGRVKDKFPLEEDRWPNPRPY